MEADLTDVVYKLDELIRATSQQHAVWLDAEGVGARISRTHRYVLERLAHRPDFPKACRPGGGHPVWKLSEILEWKLSDARLTEKTSRRIFRRRKRKLTLFANDEALVASIYAEAKRKTHETGIPHEVDHIVPILGKFVSGLHVSWNLQVITAAENRAKGNRLPS